MEHGLGCMISWSRYSRWGTPRHRWILGKPQCMMGSPDHWEFLEFFKGNWQLPCTSRQMPAREMGNSLPKHRQCWGWHHGHWHLNKLSDVISKCIFLNENLAKIVARGQTYEKPLPETMLTKIPCVVTGPHWVQLKGVFLILNFYHWIFHDDVIKWKHFPCYWSSVRGIHRSPGNSPRKGQWRWLLWFFLSTPEPTVE